MRELAPYKNGIIIIIIYIITIPMFYMGEYETRKVKQQKHHFTE